ncbi:MAG: ATP-binding protein [Myxococcota bacterium]|nr:ATP-binding protein [Myxococcota bacterium]
MDIRTQSALLAAIVGLALGLSVLLRSERTRVMTLYSVFALTASSFYLAVFFESLFSNWGNWWLHRVALGATLVVGALVPSTALGFFLEFLGVSPAANRNGRKVALLSTVFGLAVGLSPLANTLWAKVALAVWVFGAMTASVSLLLHRMRQSESRIDRARLMYLAYGAAACMLFSALDLLPRFGLPFPSLGPVLTTLYLFFLAQTLLRLRLMDLHELLGKIAAQAVLAVMLAVVFAVLTAWAGKNLPLFLFNTVVATFVVMILQDPLRTKVEERVIALFFRERFQLLRALSELRPRLSNVIEVSEVTRLVLDALNETRRVTHASVYLLADDRPGFRELDHRGPQPAAFLDAAAARGLLNAVAGGQKAVLLEHLERRISQLRTHPPDGKRSRDEIKRLSDIKSAMVQMKAGITVPLVGNDRVIGFLNLWDERVPEAYASDEIALILEIAEKLATVTENSKIYDQMRERDRLAALGEMAAGLAHEIRNPLGAIKGAAQCLDPRKLSGEDGEFLEVIVEEVNRLNGVVTAFLDYSRPLKQNFGSTDLNEVVTRTLRLIQTEMPPSVELHTELAEPINRVEADAEQLKQVLINLVQNALQAMGDAPGKITLRTQRPDRFGEIRGHEQVELSVTDTGPGIPEDQQQNIFIPFFTTKQKGTGLGLAISQRIIKNHGGNISVQSKAGEGTTFVIRMPALPLTEPIALPLLPENGTPYPGTLMAPALATPLPALPAEGERRTSRKDKRRQKAQPS